jgi:hypothetical protein
MCIPVSLLGNGLVKYSPIVVSEGLGENVTAATNTYARVAELLDSSFCQSKVGDYFFPELLVSSVIITKVSLPYTHIGMFSFLFVLSWLFNEAVRIEHI